MGGTQTSLGAVYQERLRGDRGANQDRAIECYEAALTVHTREDAPHDWATVQNNLGSAYQERLRGNRGANLEQAIACFEAAVSTLRLTNAPLTLSALVTTGGLQRELGRPIEARATWQSALALREALLSAGTSAATRGEAARHSQDLAARLALLDVELGDVASAAAALESGRAQALRAALSLDDSWLAKLPDALRQPVVQARDALTALRGAPPSATGGTSAGVGLVRAWEEQLAGTAAALEAALAAAQSASGFTPPPALDAAALARLAPAGGAVVLLAATADTGLAVMLPQGSAGQLGPEHCVMLPEANEPALRRLLGEWMNAYQTFKREWGEATKSGASPWPALLAANVVLERVLDTLWDSLMGPVLARLPELGLAAGAPLVLLPQGDLALLPLHAAWRVIDGVRRAVLDDHVVSYAPSGAVLRTASERLGRLPAQPRDLSGLFNPGHGGPLPATERIELPGLRELFGPADARTWTGRDATVERALGLCAAGASYVHFSCHAAFVWDEPENSGLALAGGQTLTVRQIVGDLRLTRNLWVTLSACETAMVDVQQQPDEFVGLPAAFLQAGAPGVMATLWCVMDEPTARVTPEFYRRHLEAAGTATDQPPAACLRDAVRWLRDQPGLAAGPTRIDDDDILFGTPAEADLTPDPNAPPPNLLQLPIVWAAYSFHGV